MNNIQRIHTRQWILCHRIVFNETNYFSIIYLLFLVP